MTRGKVYRYETLNTHLPSSIATAKIRSASMEYSYLGNSGLKVSRLCLGTMTFTESGANPRTCSQDVANKILDRFVEAGGNFIDTADVYSVIEFDPCTRNNKIFEERRIRVSDWEVADKTRKVKHHSGHKVRLPWNQGKYEHPWIIKT